MIRFFVIALALATLSIPELANAQSSALDAIKAEYEAELKAAERDLKEKYVAALDRVQQQLQSQAKLVAALAVKRERENIEAELAAGGSGGSATPGTPSTVPSGPKEIVLSSDVAKPLGKVTFVENWEALTGWREAGSGAEWSISAVPDGFYSVEIEYSCPVDGGELKAKLGSAEFQFQVSNTGGWTNFETVKAGQINIQGTHSPLEILVVDDGNSPFGVINLRSVTLSRIGD